LDLCFNHGGRYIEQNEEDDDEDDDVKFDSEDELDTITAAKPEPAVKEFSTPTSLTTVTVIEDLELDDSYQSSTNNKRKAEDNIDGGGQEEKQEESKKIPSKVST